MSYHSFRRGLDLAAKALGLAAYLFAAGANAAGTAHISVDSPSVIEGNGGPGSTTLNFTLTRSGETNSAVTLQYQTDDNSAVAPGDYTAIPSTSLTFAAGQTTANIPVLVNGDTLPESNESFFLHLTGVVDVLGPPASFSAASNFVTGSSTNPDSVTALDVNGDGRPDLAVANNSSADVSVLLNTTAPGATTPTYSGPTNFGAGTSPSSVVAVDVNGDGRPDLAVANRDSVNVSVLLNTTAPGATTPTYTGPTNFTVGSAAFSTPVSVAAVDINGDGRPDLAVANSNSNEVSVLLNTTAPGASTPTYTTPTNFTVGTSPLSVAAADINGDGRPDLAVANGNSANVSVLLNITAPGASSPSYAAPTNFAVGSAPRSVTAVDINGDGRPDLAVANANSHNVSVLLNTTAPGASTASYAAAGNFDTGSSNSPFSVTAADINGDGRSDLAVANPSNFNGIVGNVSVLLNTTAPGATTPSYTAASNIAVGVLPQSVTAADFNGDGRPDLVVANYNNNNVSVLLNTTTPAAASIGYAAASNFTVGSGLQSVTATDVNGDGRPDLVVVIQNSDSVSVLLNTTAPGATTPSYAPASNFTVGSQPFSVTAVDVNGDGRPDLAVANRVSNNISVLLNTTVPGAAAPSYAIASNFIVGSFPRSVTAVDVNGDGRPDLAVANRDSATTSVLLNTTAPGASTASYAPASNFTVGSQPFSVTAMDVNGDGRPDLAVGNSNFGDISVLLNTTAPGATTASYAAASTFTAGTNPVSVTAADVNGDGRPDLAVANRGSGDVSVLLNTTAPGASTASYAAAGNFTAGSFPFSVTAVDVNGDGRPDLAVANQGSGNIVSVLLNTTAPGAAAPSYAAASNFIAGTSPTSIVAMDVNGDGRPDLAVTNVSDDTVSVLLNRAAIFDISQGTGTILDDDTGASDTTPDAFTFVDQSGASVNPGTTITSAAVTITGINAAAAISVSGAASSSYSINGGAFTSVAGTVTNGQTVQVRHTSSASFSTATDTTLTVGGVSDTFTSTTAAQDIQPDQFTFTDATNAPLNSVQTSNAVTIGGINDAAPISVSGGGYSIGCTGAFTSNSGTITNGQTVCVSHNAAATDNTGNSTTLSIGGVMDTFTSTTGDATPAAFSFTAQNGVARTATVTSNTITISGTTVPSSISVSGGEYSVNGAAFTATAGSVSNGQTVAVRHTSAAGFSTMTTTTLTIGGVSGTFTSITEAQDTTPTAFSFVDQSGASVNPGTTITSAAVTIGGINSAAVISVSGAAGSSYSINGGAFTSAAGTVNSGDMVQVRHTSSASFSTSTDTILTVGGVSDTFTSTTAAQDTTPSAFSFVDQSGASVDLNTLITSAAVTIMGINDVASISVTNGTYSIGCTGTFTSAPGTISNGQTVCVRHTSAATPGTATNTTLTVGGVSDTFTSTTRALAGTTPTSPRGGAMGLWDALLGLLAVLTFGRRRRVAACATVTVHGFSGRIGTVAAVVAGACLATPAFAGSNAFYVSPQFNYTLSTNGGDDQAGLGGTATLGGPLASGLGWEVSVFSDHHSAGGPGLETDDAGIDASLLGFLGEGWLAPYVSGGLGLVKSKTDFNSETNPLLEAGAGLMLHPAGSPGVTFRAAVDVRRIFVGDSQVYQAQEDLVEVIVRVGFLIPFGKGG